MKCAAKRVFILRLRFTLHPDSSQGNGRCLLGKGRSRVVTTIYPPTLLPQSSHSTEKTALQEHDPLYTWKHHTSLSHLYLILFGFDAVVLFCSHTPKE
ncbi:hypothetical protein CEXT_356411 [Caerostris extrusa]|uniref:Uncharacterized protein n=1 Tax=Caerostris extrusa TaxID=172846 RepID=A0AAV4XQ60_CAEEX|nr:hypothetical protein CEXT_356411 [Caerostris extrusa]